MGQARRGERKLREAGVTLIELVLVILLIGILSVVVLPRLFDLGAFTAHGTFDTVEAALRYARKEAYASECPVTVTLSRGALTLTQNQKCTSGRKIPVPAPSGGAAYSVSIPSGTTVVFQPTGPIVFDALGGVGTAVTVDVTGGGFSGTLTVNAPSGFVSGSP